MVCDVCGKTVYWCLGHAPHRVEALLPESTEPYPG